VNLMRRPITDDDTREDGRAGHRKGNDNAFVRLAPVVACGLI